MQTGQKIHEKYANNVMSTYRPDPLTLRLDETRTFHESTGLVFRHLKYTYDPSGNLTNVDDLSGKPEGVFETGSFKYDDLYRPTTSGRH